MQPSLHGLYGFCRQFCDIVPVPLSDDPHGCRRLAATGVVLHNLTVLLENFASKHCIQDASQLPEYASEGGLSYHCEQPPHVARSAIIFQPYIDARVPAHSYDYRWHALF